MRHPRHSITPDDQAVRRFHTPPEPDLPEDPDRHDDLPDVNPGSNPDNPGDQPHVREPGAPPDIKAS